MILNYLFSATKVSAWLVMALIIASCDSNRDNLPLLEPKVMTDALFSVVSADRYVYTKYVINRLVNQEALIKASEHWQDDRALPLPAQMFRMGAEKALDSNANFTYSLLSLWPINKQNAPRTPTEKTGLQFLVENPGKNFYQQEILSGRRYFTAIYADTGMSKACIECHNKHKDSPRKDFKMGDIMGGVVIRVPL